MVTVLRSQHLALLRKDGVVSTRREGQTIRYALASEPVKILVRTLYQICCGPEVICPPPSKSTRGKMAVQDLTPADVARRLVERSILLVDVREPDEYAAERIHGALLYPLSTFDPRVKTRKSL